MQFTRVTSENPVYCIIYIYMYVNIYIYIHCTDFGHACLKDLSNTLWAMAKLEMAHLSLLDAAASLVDAACYYTRT